MSYPATERHGGLWNTPCYLKEGQSGKAAHHMISWLDLLEKAKVRGHSSQGRKGEDSKRRVYNFRPKMVTHISAYTEQCAQPGGKAGLMYVLSLCHSKYVCKHAAFSLLYILYVQYCWFIWSLCLNFFLLFISSLFHGTAIYFSY